MKRFLWLVLFTVLLVPMVARAEYDFGDNRSVTLTTKAWNSLNLGDVEAVLVYTNRCLEFYGEEAKKMQATLTDYPTGSNQEIFNFWALNDVGTCLYVQGEAYSKANMNEEAKEAYKKVIDDFGFSQCWDAKGWFWKVTEAAKEKIRAIETGKSYDFGDYRSETLTGKAWGALGKGNLDEVLIYTNKCLDLYAGKAKEMQVSLKEYPWKSKEEIFSYWALNDVGTCLFIQGEAYKRANKTLEAQKAFNRIIAEFSYAQCWDSKGWFWKPVDGAREKLAEIK
ncbi:MAG: tetratricopeptide repeat protein [Candidatus Omnitrophota bacterium]|nr:tetratricopeptide repeat protein [Candidatus Omnitrophota bacterium]